MYVGVSDSIYRMLSV